MFQLKKTNLQLVISLLFGHLAICQDFHGQDPSRENDLTQVQYSVEQETIQDLHKTQHIVPGTDTCRLARERLLTHHDPRRRLTLSSQQYSTHDSTDILLFYPLHQANWLHRKHFPLCSTAVYLSLPELTQL